jgi:hypothetical protein
MRKLLEIAGIRLAPFPEVTGKVEKILQEVVLGSKDSKNLKDINTSPSCYNGYTLKVENTDNVNGETTIVDYKGE